MLETVIWKFMRFQQIFHVAISYQSTWLGVRVEFYFIMNSEINVNNLQWEEVIFEMCQFMFYVSWKNDSYQEVIEEKSNIWHCKQ